MASNKIAGIVYERKLSVKERVFIDNYLNDFNQTRAALAVSPELTRKDANRVGNEMLRRPHVRDAVNLMLATFAMSSEEALARLGEMARITVSDFLDSSGNIDITRVQERGHLVRSFRQTRVIRGDDVIITNILDLHDSLRALELVAKHKQLFVEKSSVDHTGQLQIEYINDWRGENTTTGATPGATDGVEPGETP